MKHLNRFNEAVIGPKPKEVDTEYIDMCFVNLLDAGAKTKNDGKLYRIKIKLRESTKVGNLIILKIM